jgi:hypothetical protein
MVELLLYVLLASGITAAVSQVLIAGIRSDRNIELQQRAIDLWSRISFLIDSDVAEGNQILYNEALPAACRPGTVLFSVRVPVPAGGAVPGEGRSLLIHYFASSGNLMRCGPPFLQDGQLNVTAVANAGDNQPALVGRRVTLLIQPNDDQERSVHYHLNILTPDQTELFHPPRSSIARTRVGEIPIPP